MDALGREEDTARFTYLKSQWIRCNVCACRVRGNGVRGSGEHLQYNAWWSHLGRRCIHHSCRRHTTQSVTQYVGGHAHRPQHNELAKRVRSGVGQASTTVITVVRHQFACAHYQYRNGQTRAGTEPTSVEVEHLNRMVAISFRFQYGPQSPSASRTTMGGLMHKTGDLMRNEMDEYWMSTGCEKKACEFSVTSGALTTPSIADDVEEPR